MDPLDSGITRYLHHLDDGEFEEAASMFADDALYVRPASSSDGTPSGHLDVIVGRAAILDYFKARGPRPYRHDVYHRVTDGGTEFVAGFVDGPNAAMLSSATLDSDGLISRYIGLSGPAEIGIREAIKAYSSAPSDARLD
jgi:hypothetical protein